jgi:hypothetical protein
VVLQLGSKFFLFEGERIIFEQKNLFIWNI